MFTRFWINVLLGKTKVDYVENIGFPRVGLAEEEVLRLYISVD